MINTISQRYGMKYRAFLPNESGSLSAAMTIKILVRRASDAKVFNFTTNSWTTMPVTPSGDVWQICAEVDAGSPTYLLGYEYEWTFPENNASNGSPEKFMVFYRDFTSGDVLKVDEVLYLPASVTFDFFSITPLEVGMINMVGG